MNNLPGVDSPTNSQSPNEGTQHKFSFSGSGSEYFMIWLVNVALTIITFGLYSPWAKVRREKYFHNHTQLAGATFDYTADPVKILKGRLIVFGAFFLVALLGAFEPLIHLIFLVALTLVSPWLITIALKFRARYSSYRNLHFWFSGTAPQTFLYYLVWRVVGLITLGLLLPMAKFKERRYLITNLGYGGSRITFGSTLGAFYRTYLKFGLLALAPLLIAIGTFILRFALATFFDNSSVLTGDLPSQAADPRIAASLGKILSHLNGNFGALIIVFFGLLCAATTPIMLASLRAALARATWNNATIGSFRIRYSIGIGRYIWIQFSNLILISFTVGLAAPFCAVRAYRYKVENLALDGPADFDTFVAQAQQELSALGDQASDIYNIDLDLGL